MFIGFHYVVQISTNTSTSNIGFSVKRWFNGNLGRHNDASNEIRALLIAKLMAAFVDTFPHERTPHIVSLTDSICEQEVEWETWIIVLNGLLPRKR